MVEYNLGLSKGDRNGEVTLFLVYPKRMAVGVKPKEAKEVQDMTQFNTD